MPTRIAAQCGHQVPCIEQRRERREETHEERGETRKERGESRGDRMTPDLSFLIGVVRGVLLSLRCMCHVSAFGFVDPISFFFAHTGAKQKRSLLLMLTRLKGSQILGNPP